MRKVILNKNGTIENEHGVLYTCPFGGNCRQSCTGFLTWKDEERELKLAAHCVGSGWDSFEIGEIIKDELVSPQIPKWVELNTQQITAWDEILNILEDSRIIDIDHRDRDEIYAVKLLVMNAITVP